MCRVEYSGHDFSRPWSIEFRVVVGMIVSGRLCRGEHFSAVSLSITTQMSGYFFHHADEWLLLSPPERLL